MTKGNVGKSEPDLKPIVPSNQPDEDMTCNYKTVSGAVFGMCN